MFMDIHTETVAHFAGLFHLQTEDARLKDAYAAFRAARDEAKTPAELGTIGVSYNASFALEGFMPGIAYVAPYYAIGGVAQVFAGQLPFFAISTLAASGINVSSVAAGSQAAVTPPPPLPQIAPPSSVAVVQSQDNTLLDLDEFGSVKIAAKDLHIEDAAQVSKAEAILKALKPIDTGAITANDTNAVEFATTVYEAVQSVDPALLSDVGSFIADQEELDEVVGAPIVDGEVAEELPRFADLLPTYFQEDDAQEQTVDEDAPADTLTDAQKDALTEDLEPFAHHIPEAVAPLLDTATPISAPALEPETDDAVPANISEGEEVTFVVSDPPKDTDAPKNHYEIEDGHAIVTGANQAVNEVAIASNWLDAPLIAVMQDAIEVDAITQINVIVDIDHTPENTPADTAPATSNSVNAAQFSTTENPFEAVRGEDGFPTSWYVARIEGDLVSVNWVEQHNYVMDGDSVQVEIAGVKSQIVTGENTTINVSTLTEIGFGYDMIIVGGHMIDMSLISQSNIIIDNDIVDFGDVPPDVVSTSDNLALNVAAISHQGVDTHIGLSDSLREAGDALADYQTAALPDMLGSIDMFDDATAVRVLYIEGDYVTINSIDQRNVVGDSDHVAVALDDFITEHDGDISVTTGSNAALNLANVASFGLDSQVQVGGHYYSDALLYQAELIDTSADPTGVGITSLANEAVAFLAEGLIESDDGTAEDALIIDTALQAGGASTGDVLTTVLA